jgi:hypothetical protein
VQAGNLTVRQAAGKVRDGRSLVPGAGAVAPRRGSAARVHASPWDGLTGQGIR